MAEEIAVVHSHCDQELLDCPVCRMQIRRITVGRRSVSRILLVMRDWYVVLQSAGCYLLAHPATPAVRQIVWTACHIWLRPPAEQATSILFPHLVDQLKRSRPWSTLVRCGRCCCLCGALTRRDPPDLCPTRAAAPPGPSPCAGHFGSDCLVCCAGRLLRTRSRRWRSRLTSEGLRVASCRLSARLPRHPSALPRLRPRWTRPLRSAQEWRRRQPCWPP